MKQKQTPALLPDPILIQNARMQSRGHRLWKEILIFVLVFLIGTCAESFLSTIPTIAGMMQTPSYQEMMRQIQSGTLDASTYMDTVMQITAELPSWTMAAVNFATAGLIVTVLVYCCKMEKRRLSTLGLTKKHALSEYAIGMGVGLLLFVLVIGLNLLTGGVTFVGVTFQADALPLLILTLLGYFVQGASEEILCRGYLCVSTARWMPLWVGIVVNSIAFALLHMANTGISLLALLNLFLFGVFMSVYMVRRGNLWGACAIHAVWNFVQGNVFGLQVSGITSTDSVLQMQQADGMTLWNGGAFGPEGGLCVTIVLVVAILVVLLFCRNRDLGQHADPVSLQQELLIGSR